MKNVLILDLETTGLEPETDRVIEVGTVLWSVEHRRVVECFSALLPADENPAEPFNAIPAAVLGEGSVGRDIAWEIASQSATRAEAVIAHYADFDLSFVRREPDVDGRLLDLPWICTAEDFVWPLRRSANSLVGVALAHGVAVTSAHRAISDCLLLARLLERLDDAEDRLHLALQRAQRPKAEFIARTAYQDKDLVKAAGFHWNGTVWWRRMAVEDAEKLPFDVVAVDDAIEEARV